MYISKQHTRPIAEWDDMYYVQPMTERDTFCKLAFILIFRCKWWLTGCIVSAGSCYFNVIGQTRYAVITNTFVFFYLSIWKSTTQFTVFLFCFLVDFHFRMFRFRFALDDMSLWANIIMTAIIQTEVSIF